MVKSDKNYDSKAKDPQDWVEDVKDPKDEGKAIGVTANSGHLLGDQFVDIRRIPGNYNTKAPNFSDQYYRNPNDF